MSDRNMVILEGNITNDLDLQTGASGRTYLRFGLAVNKSRRNADGDWENEPHFFDVTAFGDIADHVASSLSKGSRAVVTGRLEQSKWENEEGEKRSRVAVIADDVAPSLRWATASVTKTKSNGGNAASDATVDAAVEQLEEAFGPL